VTSAWVFGSFFSQLRCAFLLLPQRIPVQNRETLGFSMPRANFVFATLTLMQGKLWWYVWADTWFKAILPKKKTICLKRRLTFRISKRNIDFSIFAKELSILISRLCSNSCSLLNNFLILNYLWWLPLAQIFLGTSQFCLDTFVIAVSVLFKYCLIFVWVNFRLTPTPDFVQTFNIHVIWGPDYGKNSQIWLK